MRIRLVIDDASEEDDQMTTVPRHVEEPAGHQQEDDLWPVAQQVVAEEDHGQGQEEGLWQFIGDSPAPALTQQRSGERPLALRWIRSAISASVSAGLPAGPQHAHTARPFHSANAVR